VASLFRTVRENSRTCGTGQVPRVSSGWVGMVAALLFWLTLSRELVVLV